MKFKVLITGCFLVLIWVSFAFSLPWKMLHTEADKLDVEHAQQAVDNNPNSLDCLYVLGLSYLNVYEHEKAKAVFADMLKKSPDLVEAEWGIAEVLRREYKIKESQAKLKQVIDLNPDFFPAYISLSYIKFNLKEYEQAVTLSAVVIRKGKKKADKHTLARAYLIFAGAKGMIAHNGGPLSKFINGTPVFTNIKRARALMPHSAEVYYGLGCFYLLAPVVSGGDIDQAQKYLEKTISTDPNITDAYVRLAQIYNIKGNIKKFNYYLNLALEREPQNFLANDVKNQTCDFICIERE